MTHKMMPVTDILNNVIGSLDFRDADGIDWWEVLANKVSHSHFDWLCDEIADKGFILPIVLVDNGDGGFTMGNGHHRLCAAILLGLDEIPVIIDDDGDYWRLEDSHDYNNGPGDEHSFDYWNLLKNNVSGIHYGDANNSVYRHQYNDGDNDSCDYDECGGCGMIDDECVCAALCEHCDIYAPDYADHMIGCPEREYERISCMECFMRGTGYRFNCKCLPWSEAIAEHESRGYRLVNGAWHPPTILAEAYAEHEEWLKDETIRVVRQEWQDEVDALRALAGAHWRASTLAINGAAARVADRWAAYMAL